MSYAVRLANRDYDVHKIFRALARKPSGKRDPGSVKYARVLDERGQEAADRYARRTAENAVKFVADNPRIVDRAGALVRLHEIQGLANALPWAIYGGPAARRSLEATFVVAERVGGVVFGLALREWAELAGQRKRAIEHNRDTLLRLGWLKRNPSDRLGRTARFTLRVPRDIQPTRVRFECPTLAGRGWVGHDAFREAALGDVGWLLLASIGSPSMIADLGGRTGLGLDDVEDLITKFARLELVEFDGGIVQPASDIDDALDRAADAFKTAGSAEKDRKEHRDDREDFRARGAVNVPPRPKAVR